MIILDKNAWDKKKRTKLSSLMVGDIFALKVDGGGYAFGRLAAKILGSFAAEFFDKIKTEPELSASEYQGLKAVVLPIEIDSYGLFDRKIEGDWRIIGRDAAYVYPNPDRRIFKIGVPQNFKYINMAGDWVDASSDFGDVPYLTTNGDYHVQEIIRTCTIEGSMRRVA